MNEIIAISTLVSIAGVIWFLCWPYQNYRVDSFRQSMFRLRDEMFDYAAQGKVSFDDPAYQMLRETFNGFIRIAEDMSLFDLTLLTIFGASDKKSGAEYYRKIKTYLNKLNADQKKKLTSIQMKMHVLAVRHIILKSPVLLILLLFPLAILILLAIVFRLSIRRITLLQSKLDSVAFHGCLD